jgi:hypothetical protein
MSVLVSREQIEQRILVNRGHRVMLDSELASMYGVTTFNLNKAVKRNIDRFPEDFMFQLSAEEATALRFQIGMSKTQGRGGTAICTLPFHRTRCGYAFYCAEEQAGNLS